MGRYFTGFVTVLLLLLPSIQADSQWIKATGPSEGRIGRLVIDPLDSKTVYVNGRQLYRSSDGGKTFDVFSGFAEKAPLMLISSIAISRNEDGPIIMLNSMGGLIVSEDRGKTWKVSEEKKIRYGNELQAGPKDSKVFYCHNYSLIGRSDDNGESWRRCKGLPEEVTSIEHFVADRFDEDTISFMYRKDGKTHFMLSRDGGKSFKDVDFPPGEDFVASVSTDPGYRELLYVCTQENGWGRGPRRRYFYSYDDGKTWEQFFDPNSGDVMTKAIDAKLQKVFPDIARSPVPFRRGTMLNRNDVVWSEDRPGFMLASLRGRLFRSEDFGTTWEKTGKGIVAGVAYHIVLDPNDPQSAYCADITRVWHTADRGKTWERMSLEDYWYLRHIRYSSDGKDVFVTSNGIWKGTSDGKSWEKKWSTRDLNRRPHGIFMKTTKNDDGEAVESMVVAVSKFLLESTDGGEEWKEAGEIDLEFARGQGPRHFAQMRTDGKDVWYADSANGLVQSADYGKTWEELKDVPRERRFWSLGPNGSLWSIDRRYLYIFVGKETRIALPYDSSRVYPKTVMVDPQDAETGYVGMSDGSIVRITGRGTRVEKLKGGPKGIPISSLAVSPHDGSLWVGTDGNGVWILESPKKYPRLNTPPADIPFWKKVTIPRTAIVRINEVSPISQPAGSKLEFRVAPKPSDLNEAQLELYVNLLKAGKMGFWWKSMKRHIGPIPDHAWLPIAGELANAPQFVTGEHNGQKYVLVSDKPGQTMLPGEGNDAWRLAKAYVTQDHLNQPAIGFELDARGAELFAALTKANINNALAIVVDGKVVSAPVLKAPLGKTGIITGQFTEQEVNALVQALRAGMPPASQPATRPADEWGKANNGEKAGANQGDRPTHAAHLAVKEAMSKDLSFGVAEAPTQPEAIHTWEEFLECDGRSKEQELFAMWRIASLCAYNFDRRRGEKPNMAKAKEFLAKVREHIPGLVCCETINATTVYASMWGDPIERAMRKAECYRWMRTRTDEMVVNSAPIVSRTGHAVDLDFYRQPTFPPQVSLEKKEALLRDVLRGGENTMVTEIKEFMEWNDDQVAATMLLSSIKDIADPAHLEMWRNTKSRFDSE